MKHENDGRTSLLTRGRQGAPRQHGGKSLSALFAILFVPVATVIMGQSAHSADLASDCCADLEERISVLEAAAARKGNRKVSLSVSGQVNRAVLFWDDRVEQNAYAVGNKNDQTNISFDGDAEIAKGWKAGYAITLRIEDNLSDSVDQDVAYAGDGFQIWKSHWYIESESFGRFAVGRESRASDTAPETDLSETGVAAYAGVQDIAGGFLLRRADGGLAGLAWGDLGNHFNGDTTDLIRWDSPEYAGFMVSATWGADDIWDAGLRYAGEGGGFTFEAALAYTDVSDAPSDFADVDHATTVGSASLLHIGSGLNVTVAAGHRTFNATVLDNDGLARTPADSKFVYAKIGWLAGLTPWGKTAFYGEYGRFEDFITALDDGGAAVASLSVLGAADCVAAGGACRISASEREVWGLGIVQHIDAAAMSLFAGCRHHSAEFDLRDGAGAPVNAAPLADFDTVVAGAKIAF